MKKQTVNSSDGLPQPCLTQAERELRLVQAARQFDRMIRHELRQFGAALWGVDHVLGIIQIHRHRIRFDPGAQICTWRVEHDLLPLDQYRCAAYQVQLMLDDCDAPITTVRSQAATHRVASLTAENLQAALREAAQEAPLVVPRDMGEVNDP